MKLRSALIVAAALLVAPGCKKNESASATGPGAKGFATLLDHMPKDSSFVMGLSPSNASKSTIFKGLSDQMLAGAIPSAGEMKAKCGLNIMTDLVSIMVAASDFNDDEGVVMAATGNFDRDKLETCITVTGGTVNGSSYLVTGEGDAMNAYWPTPNTLLLSKLSEDELKKSAAGSNLKQNSKMMALVNQVDMSSSVWMAGKVPAEAADMAQGMFTAPDTAYLAIKFSAAMHVNIGADFASESDAKGAESTLRLLLEQGKSMMPAASDIIKTVKIVQSGANLKVTAKVTEEAANRLESEGGLSL